MHLCEEQLDAITEWRDDRLTSMSERLQVRFNDLIGHIERVKDHARRPSSRRSRRCSSISRQPPPAPTRSSGS